MDTKRSLLNNLSNVLLIGLTVLSSVTCSYPTDVVVGTDFPLIREPAKKDVGDSVLKAYQQDAYGLAVRYMNETSNKNVEIPTDLFEALYNGLIHIYNRRDLAERDTVVEIYPIHIFFGYRYMLYEIIVIVNPTYAWVQRWKNGDRFTGNGAIDTLMKNYDLVVRDYTVTPWGSEWAVLRSSRPLNVHQLTERFKRIDGVATAEPNGGCCDGNDIRAAKEQDAWLYTFRLGWGDCPSGCINSRYWDFRVFVNGNVEYLGSRGDSLPPSVSP